MGAMASSVPCVASNIRGNTDLMFEKCKEYLCSIKNEAEFVKIIEELINSKSKCELNSTFCKININHFSNEVVINEMKGIYNCIL